MGTNTSRSSALLSQSQRPLSPDLVAEYYDAGLWREITMVDEIWAHIQANPKKAAVVTYREGSLTPETITYGQLGMLADRFAAFLIDLGVQKDDIVSVQLPNTWEFAVIALGTMRAGAVLNPLVAIFRHRELSFMLQRAESKVLVVTDTFRGFDHAALGAQLKDEIDTLETVIVVPRLHTGVPEGCLDFRKDISDKPWEQRAGLADLLAERRRGSDEPITLMYTSGTTGEPKGTVHSYNSMWCVAEPLFNTLDLTSDDVCFMPSTMGHLTGFLWGMMRPLGMGQTCVFQEAWNAEQLIAFADHEGCTWTVSATTFVADLLRAARAVDRKVMTKFRYFVCGGGPIPPAIPLQVAEVLPFQLLALWGTSECGIITIHHPGDGPEVVSDHDGWPTPPQTLKVVDYDGQPIGRGVEGRLMVQGPAMFRGYFGRMDLYDDVVDADGWFDTGDLGIMRESGGIRITGRSKDIILRGGENIPVVEIENALFQHPQVREVVVVAYPDDRMGEKACAVVVPEGDAPTLEDLKAYLDGIGMAKQYWPERLEIVAEMPKTPSGKIQKFVLRNKLAAGEGL